MSLAMQLRVNTVATTTTICAHHEQSVEEFQKSLEIREGIPADRQELWILGQAATVQILPEHLLSDYEFPADGELLLLEMLPRRPPVVAPGKPRGCTRSTSKKAAATKLTSGKGIKESRKTYLAFPLPPMPQMRPPSLKELLLAQGLQDTQGRRPSPTASPVRQASAPAPALASSPCKAARSPSRNAHSSPAKAPSSAPCLHSHQIPQPPRPQLPTATAHAPHQDEVARTASGSPTAAGTVALAPPAPHSAREVSLPPKGTRTPGSGSPPASVRAATTAVTSQAAPATLASSRPLATPGGQPFGSLSWSPPTSLPSQQLPGGGAAARGGDASPPASARLAAGGQAGCSSPGSRGQGGSSTPAGAPPQVARIRRTDLQRIGRLGVGAFGIVTLEADRRTGRTYALKAVSKGYLAQLRMEYSVLNEKRILRMVDSPFVVRLIATYNGREHVYFLLEAALGGELFTTYERLRLYGSERHARFYVGCVGEALTHLHERHVIYRDLKPENLLLDARGYCKLTDMGLAKVTQGKTYTLVGTPDYMAPEVIAGTGHNKSVDWWMLGVLLFELLAGKAPFEAESTQQVYELVKLGIEVVRFPPECKKHAGDLVRLLCRQNPDNRMRTPYLREQPFFRGFDWGLLRALRMTPPHLPHVHGPRDLANFRSCDGEDPPATPYQDTGTGWDAGFEDDAIGGSQAYCLAPAPQHSLSTCSTRAPSQCGSVASVGNGGSSQTSVATSGSSTPAAASYAPVVYSPRSNVEAVHFHKQQSTRQQPAAFSAAATAGTRWPAGTQQGTAPSKAATRPGQSPPTSPILGGC